MKTLVKNIGASVYRRRKGGGDVAPNTEFVVEDRELEKMRHSLEIPHRIEVLGPAEDMEVPIGDPENTAPAVSEPAAQSPAIEETPPAPAVPVVQERAPKAMVNNKGRTK